ncbi:MAG: hypothetical protein U0487_00150 [Patescibacteria group bacterium]
MSFVYVPLHYHRKPEEAATELLVLAILTILVIACTWLHSRYRRWQHEAFDKRHAARIAEIEARRARTDQLVCQSVSCYSEDDDGERPEIENHAPPLEDFAPRREYLLPAKI